MNLPNKITLGRLVVALVYFVLLSCVDISAGAAAPALPWNRVLLDLAIVLFLVASVTDWIDGYLARKYAMVTDFGRVMDPCVDKVLICGSFAYFLTFPEIARLQPAWMVVIVLTREFVVSGVRALAESRGVAFGAKAGGKIKMVVQCIAITAALLYYTHLQDYAWCQWAALLFFAASTAITIVSAIPYLTQARSIFKDGPPPGPPTPPSPPPPGGGTHAPVATGTGVRE